MFYFLQPPNSSCFWSPNKEVFSAKDVVFCHCQAQMVLLPDNFLLLVALRSNSREHHNDLENFFLLVPKNLQYLGSLGPRPMANSKGVLPLGVI